MEAHTQPLQIRIFAKLLASIILKMYYSPCEEVKTIDNNCPYILMDEKQWWWSKVTFHSSFKLKSGKLMKLFY
jgi:hypothetical protein